MDSSSVKVFLSGILHTFTYLVLELQIHYLESSHHQTVGKCLLENSCTPFMLKYFYGDSYLGLIGASFLL